MLHIKEPVFLKLMVFTLKVHTICMVSETLAPKSAIISDFQSCEDKLKEPLTTERHSTPEGSFSSEDKLKEPLPTF